ncbi:TIGR01620 family protein [Roseospira goensis]|uniref:Putative membrane protein n=1 Tax=Roseospira goensis TaxID=391922 RepID=A0A7W6RZQ2_9PROT|nr:TIGR01620 family protein [Roseospira goensis]MBB4286220.1 putative membrane protein [Roseospira goensis]
MTERRPPERPSTGDTPRQPGVVDPTLVAPSEPSRPRVRSRPTPEPAPARSAGPAPGPAAETLRAPDDRAPPPATVEAEAAAPPAEKPARWGRVVGLFVALAAAFLVYDTGRALVDIWSGDWIGGALLTALAAAFLAALGTATMAEVRALRRLGEVDRFRETLGTALAQDQPTRLRQTLGPILALVRARRPELVKAFTQRSQGLTDTDAVLKQFRGAVLAPLDQEARRTVRVNALAVMGATAVSPHPALDVAIVIWRSTVMVRRVAEVYGLRPSGLATLKLTKQVVVSAAIAVAADPTGDVVATTLGGGLAEKVSARFAEGSISGLRAFRLGMRAIEICRPLPFEPDERKGTWQTLVQG